MAGAILAGSEYQRESRDAFVNIRTGQAENCVYLAADHAFNDEKDLSFSLSQQSCDQFSSKNERVFEISKRVAGGVLAFSRSAYEDSWFAGLYTGPKEKETMTYKKSHSNIYLWRNDLVGGYQWHFEEGFILTLGYGFSGEIVVSHSTHIAEGEDEKKIREIKRLTKGKEFDSNFLFVIGWRF